MADGDEGNQNQNPDGGGGNAEATTVAELSKVVGNPDDGSPIWDKVWNLRINGEDVTRTTRELLQDATKVGGADAQFREASEMRKLSEGDSGAGKLFKEIMGSGTAPTRDQVLQLAEMQGKRGTDAENFVSEYYRALESMEGQQGGAGEGGGSGAQGLGNQSTGDRKITLDDLSPELRSELDAGRAARTQLDAADYRKKMLGELESMVDKDPVLGKLGGKDEKRRQIIVDSLQNEMARRVLMGESDGAEMRRFAMQTLRSHYVGLGLSDTEKEDVVSKLPTGLGLGPSDSAALRAAHEGGKSLERVPAGQPGADANFLARFVHRHMRHSQK